LNCVKGYLLFEQKNNLLIGKKKGKWGKGGLVLSLHTWGDKHQGGKT